MEIKRFQHYFAVEDERCFLATVDSKFDLVPLAFGFFDAQRSSDIASSSLRSVGIISSVFTYRRGCSEVFPQDEQVARVKASLFAFGIGFVGGRFADLHFQTERPNSFQVTMDMEQQSGVAVMFGARFESFLVPLVFEFEYKMAELFLGDEAIGLLRGVSFFSSVNVDRFLGFIDRVNAPVIFAGAACRGPTR